MINLSAELEDLVLNPPKKVVLGCNFLYVGNAETLKTDEHVFENEKGRNDEIKTRISSETKV